MIMYMFEELVRGSAGSGAVFVGAWLLKESLAKSAVAFDRAHYWLAESFPHNCYSLCRSANQFHSSKPLYKVHIDLNSDRPLETILDLMASKIKTDLAFPLRTMGFRIRNPPLSHLNIRAKINWPPSPHDLRRVHSPLYYFCLLSLYLSNNSLFVL